MPSERSKEKQRKPHDGSKKKSGFKGKLKTKCTVKNWRREDKKKNKKLRSERTDTESKTKRQKRELKRSLAKQKNCSRKIKISSKSSSNRNPS